MASPLSFRGSDIVHHAIGAGRPALLLHGSFLDHRMWMPLVPWLSDDFEMTLIDLPGHGSGSTLTAWIPLAEVARGIGELLDQLGHRDWLVIGHSGGGTVAALVAVERPDLVGTLVLHEPGLLAGCLDDRDAEAFGRTLDEIWALLRAGRHEQALRRFFGELGGDADAWGAMQPFLRDLVLANAPTLALAVPEGTHALDSDFMAFDPRVAGLDLPVMLTMGADSPQVLRAGTPNLAKRIPHAELVEIPGDHGAPALRADTFAAAVRRFAKRRG